MGVMEDRRRIIAAQPHLVTASGSAVLVDIAEPKIERLAVTFSPVQTGSGTQSPTNVRPIMGYATIMASIGTMPVDISLGGTYYGGTVDLVSGVMTVTHELWKYSSSAGISISTKNDWKIIWVDLGDRYAIYSATDYAVFGDQYVTGTNELNYTTPPVYSVNTASNNLHKVFLKVYATDLPTQDTAGARAFLDSTMPSFYVPLTTPETVTLTPQTIAALRGQQTVTSPAGAVGISYWTH